MITTADLAGYTASTMVLFTFMTKDMRLLRVLAAVLLSRPYIGRALITM